MYHTLILLQYSKAKETYLRACRKTPSSQTWRGVGVACYHLNDLSQAEDALCEANILNSLDSTVWAYLTLVCLKVIAMTLLCVCGKVSTFSKSNVWVEYK